MSNLTKINGRQKQILADFMGVHQDLAKNKLNNCPRARAVSQRLWEQLKIKLDGAGPPVKSVAAWRKVFADQNHTVKKKLSFNKFSKQQTGGGPYEEKTLTAAEEIISEASGLTPAVEGISSVKVFGAVETRSPEIDHDIQFDLSQLLGDESDYITDVEETYTRSKKQKPIKEDKTTILKKNTDNTENWRAKKAEKLDKLILLKEKSNRNMKDLLRKEDKLLELKKKSLKMKEEEHAINMEIKRMDLDIKTLELEVLRRTL